MVTEAAKKLFVHKPEMMDGLPPTGIVTRVFQIMAKANPTTCRSAEFVIQARTVRRSIRVLWGKLKSGGGREVEGEFRRGVAGGDGR